MIFLQHSLIHSHNFFVYCWNMKVLDGVLLFRLLIVFWKIQVALRRVGFGATCAGESAIWADSAGWTGWEVLTVHDEWKMALVTVLVEVEKVKMAVVCQSADTEAHWE